HSAISPTSYCYNSPLFMASTLAPYSSLFRSQPHLPPASLPDCHATHGRSDLRPYLDLHRRAHGERGHGVGDQSPARAEPGGHPRSEEHTSELQSRENLVCRPLLEKKKIDCLA